MKWFRHVTRTLIWIWLAGSICFSVFFALEYKNSLVIEGAEPKLQRIDESTNIVELRRTARMYVDFLYGVHGASLRLWKISLIYGLANIAFAGCCAACFGRSSRPKVANDI
jgi:hypothetical protein